METTLIPLHHIVCTVNTHQARAAMQIKVFKNKAEEVSEDSSTPGGVNISFVDTN